MLITKEVEIILTSNTVKWYEERGYKIPKKAHSQRKNVQVSACGEIILVKVEDLPDCSHTLVDIKCDGCEKELIGIVWKNYKRSIQADGKYYCQKCALNGHEKWINFEEWCYKNLSIENANNVLSRWNDNLNIDKDGNILTPKDVSYGSQGLNGKGYWFKCLDHPEHGSEQKNICSFTSGQGNIGCSKCNVIAFTHPHLVQFLVNKEDAFNYTMGTDNKIFIRCEKCGNEKEMLFYSYLKQGLCCEKCSDGKPFSEKYFYSFLDQLSTIKFQTQLSKTTFDWCENYKYDFYLNTFEIIVETHGLQHYKEIKGSNWNSLKEIQENDISKEKIAKENNIKNYVILDCRESNGEWIRRNIMESNLPKLLNFIESDIDWLQCYEFACNSLVKEVCEDWRNGIKNTLELATKYKIHRGTVVEYLKQGVDLGWSDYNSKEESQKHIMSLAEKNNIKVICVTTNEIFDSIIEAGEKYNVSRGNISLCCSNNSKQNSAGKHILTRERLLWMYYDEFLIKNETLGWREDYLNKFNGKVICLTTGETFNSQKEAGERYDILSSSISACIRGKMKSAGKLEDGTKMQWMYYDKYLEINK